MKNKLIIPGLLISTLLTLPGLSDACFFGDYFGEPSERVAKKVANYLGNEGIEIPLTLCVEELEHISSHDIGKITYLRLSMHWEELPGKIKELTGLKKLDLSNTCIEDLDGIGNLQKLEELNLSSCKELNDDALEILTQLPKLRVLYLEDTLITKVPEIKTLEKLSLKRCKKVINLTSVAALANLTWLDISFIPRLYDNPERGVEPLESLENLNYLITCERIKALPSFRTLTNIKNVDAHPDIRFTFHEDKHHNGYRRVTINGSFRIPNCIVQ